MGYVNKDGSVHLKIIGPGQGSSAYYEADQLERDADVYQGAHIYWDHPTAKESRERPERSLRNFTGVIRGVPQYEKFGEDGPGVYGDALVFKPYRGAVEEMAPYIGVSWRGKGTTVIKNKDGKDTRVAERFTDVKSVDFVTKAGAGGKALPMNESIDQKVDDYLERFRASDQYSEDKPLDEIETQFIEWLEQEDVEEANEEDSMDLQEAQRKLTDSEGEVSSLNEEKEALTKDKDDLTTENEKLKEAVALRDAADLISEEIRSFNETRKKEHKTLLPDITVERLSESLAQGAPMDDGKLDKDKLKSKVTEAIKEEVKYIEELTSKAPGITGMGETQPSDQGQETLKQAFVESYVNTGMDKEEAEKMAKIAAQGR